jgi:hypothetical protein
MRLYTGQDGIFVAFRRLAAPSIVLGVLAPSCALAQPVIPIDPRALPPQLGQLRESLDRQDIRLAPLVAECPSDRRAEALSRDSTPIEMDCNLSLDQDDVVTREIRFSGAAASGLTLDCNNALISAVANGGRGDRDMIRLTPRLIPDGSGGQVWSRPQSITIKNCRIEGSVRIYGAYASPNVTRPDDAGVDAVRRSSRLDENHTARLQDLAPRGIVLKNVSIDARGRTNLYIGAGVTHSALLGSSLRGSAASVAIYLEAESAENIIADNDIGVTSDDDREQIAIDGSAGNLIVGNRIRTSGRRGGGIYLYRNCGEAGTVRHLPPERNVIVHNDFLRGRSPSVIGGAVAIFIGSRQGGRSYCRLDDAWPFGSGLDDRDFARRNVIARNWYSPPDRHHRYDPFLAINDTQNLAFENASRQGSPPSSSAGCYLPEAFPTPWLEHGQSTTLTDRGGGPRCDGRRYACDSATITSSPVPCDLGARIEVREFACLVTGNNDGCSIVGSCQADEELLSLRAACNLEHGVVDRGALSGESWGTVVPLRVSDHPPSGRCAAGGVEVSDQIGLDRSLAQGPMSPGARVTFSCREYDRNGGDCQVVGQLACRRR